MTILYKLTFISTIFSGYKILGTSLVGIGLAVLIVLLLAKNIKLNYRDFVTTILLMIYVIVVVSSSDEKYHIFQNIRYWYGVMFYIYLFKSYSSSLFITFRFFRFACAVYLLEAILINTIIDSSLIHYVTSDLHSIFLGFYERPVGFTENPGTTLVFLICYLYYVEIYRRVRACNFDMLLITFTVFISFSTTAIVVYIAYVFLKYITFTGLSVDRRIFLVFVFSGLILMPLTFIFLNTNEQQLQKYSAEYIVKIVALKLSAFNQDNDYLMFGKQLTMTTPATSGDFGLMILFRVMGFAGFVLYFIILKLFYNMREYKIFLPVLFLIHFGSLHYPSAFSPAGQLLTAMILILRNTSVIQPMQFRNIPISKE
jgi:hypothetical protein